MHSNIFIVFARIRYPKQNGNKYQLQNFVTIMLFISHIWAWATLDYSHTINKQYKQQRMKAEAI